MISFVDAKYLKHAGAQIDVKVTIRTIDGVTMIYMRDLAFTNFQSALRYLRRIAEEEMVRIPSPEMELA